MNDKIKEHILNANPIQWVEYSEERRDSSELIWDESKRKKVLSDFLSLICLLILVFKTRN
jgi:hypothetical protein